MENSCSPNPVWRSRFPIHINFKDYDEEELFQIAPADVFGKGL